MWRWAFVSFVVTAVTGSLWATEASLPLRTHLAFAGIVVLGTAWMAVAAYELTRRRPLYAADRVLATGLAVVATSAGGIVTTVVRGERSFAAPPVRWYGPHDARSCAASVW